MKLVGNILVILSFLGSKLGAILVIGVIIAFLLVSTKNAQSNTSTISDLAESPISSSYKGLTFITEEINGIEFDLTSKNIDEQKNEKDLKYISQVKSFKMEDNRAQNSRKKDITESLDNTKNIQSTSTPILSLEPTTEVQEEIVKVTPEPLSEQIWNQLAECESANRWDLNTGNGYYGGLQFSQSAWESVGGSGRPSEASREEQIEKGKTLQARSGWGAWGVCAKRLGLN